MSETKSMKTTDTKLVTLKIDDIIPNPDQPRQHFDEEELQRLADNIKEFGLRKPIDVRPIGKGKYELIDGERRYRAHKLLNRSEIRAIVLEDVKSRKEATKQAIIINEFHKAHTDEEREAAIFKLCETMSTPEAAKAIGLKSHSSIATLLEAYKFRTQTLPVAMATSVTTSMLKHTSFIKDKSIRIGILKMLVDRTIKQEQTREALEILKKTNNRILQQAVFAGLFKLETLKEINDNNASSKDYDFQKDLDRFMRYFQEKLGLKPMIDDEMKIERYKLIPMELKREIVPICLQAMDYLDFREQIFKNRNDMLIAEEPTKAEEIKKKTAEIQAGIYKDVYEPEIKKSEEKWSKEVIEAKDFWVGVLTAWEFMQKTEHIEDLDLRIGVLDFMLDYHLIATYIHQSSKNRVELLNKKQ